MQEFFSYYLDHTLGTLGKLGLTRWVNCKLEQSNRPEIKQMGKLGLTRWVNCKVNTDNVNTPSQGEIGFE